MARYPLEAGDAEPFTPNSLAHIEGAPKIFLRWGSPREKEQQRRVMDEEGAVFHSQDAQRDALIEGMKALFSEDEASIWAAEAKSWWDAQDSYEKEVADIPEADRPPFEFENSEILLEVMENVARDYRPFRRMQADNNQFNRLVAHAINSVIIVGVEGLDTKVSKIGRYIDFDTARQIADDLDVWARDRKIDSELRPAQELGMECMMRLFLGKERSGNSASPAPSDPTPDTSTTGAGETSGKSKASGRSRKTRASA